MATKKPGEPWPFDEQLKTLKDRKLSEVEGKGRLGALAFSDAPNKVQRVIKLTDDLKQEDREELTPQLLQDVSNQLTRTIDITNGMAALSAEAPDVHGQRASLQQQLDEVHNWFLQTVRPQTVTARSRQSKLTSKETTALANLNKRLQEALAREQRLAKSLESREELVETTRRSAGKSAAKQLGQDYQNQANDHRRKSLWWGLALAVVIVITAYVGSGLFRHNQQEGSVRLVGAIGPFAVDLLVLGLLLYLIRLTSLQFRVHRNLEAVAASKATAIATFYNLVGSASSETRGELTRILAQAVFITEEPGFIDGASEHVTLVERFVAALGTRLNK